MPELDRNAGPWDPAASVDTETFWHLTGQDVVLFSAGVSEAVVPVIRTLNTPFSARSNAATVAGVARSAEEHSCSGSPGTASYRHFATPICTYAAIHLPATEHFTSLASATAGWVDAALGLQFLAALTGYLPARDFFAELEAQHDRSRIRCRFWEKISSPTLHTPDMAALSPIGRALARRLGLLPCVTAVFLAADENLVKVYTVVDEFSPEVVERVMEEEEKVQQLFLGRQLDFRVRASQGRAADRVVPINAEPVFERGDRGLACG